MKHLTWMTLAVALIAFGCDGKSEEPAAEPEVAEPAADEGAGQAKTAEEEGETAEEAEQAGADEVVTPEDYEEEAVEAITEENLEEEVGRLEEALREELGE